MISKLIKVNHLKQFSQLGTLRANPLKIPINRFRVSLQPQFQLRRYFSSEIDKIKAQNNPQNEEILISEEDQKSQKKSKTGLSRVEESTKDYIFHDKRIVRLTENIEKVRESSVKDYLKIFLHVGLAVGCYSAGLTYISPIFCWFASSSIVRSILKFFWSIFMSF